MDNFKICGIDAKSQAERDNEPTNTTEKLSEDMQNFPVKPDTVGHSRPNFAQSSEQQAKQAQAAQIRQELSAVQEVDGGNILFSDTDEEDIGDDFSNISMPALNEEEIADGRDNFVLPDNYSNKYNLTRGNFEPVDIEEALNICLNELGKVDVEYISSLSLLSLKDVILKLRGKIYKDPDLGGEYFYEGFCTEDEYLSGNIMKKYKSALRAEREFKGMYTLNIRALSSILPPKPRFEDIYFALGASYLPPRYVDDFVQYLYRLSLVRNKRVCEAVYSRCIHKWILSINIDSRSTVLANKAYGTERMNMFKILEKILNHEQIRIADIDENSDSKSRKFNKEETMLAEEKRIRLNEAFLRWLNNLLPEQKEELTEIYYERYCCFKSRDYSACRIKIPEVINGIELYDYQKTAIARIITSPSTLLAHNVGAGKTYVMVAAAHELRQKNKSGKSMIVVPNSILSQWEKDYKTLYPDANILVVTPQSFSPANRAETLERMRDDYEAIIIAYSTFEMIPSGYDYAKRRIHAKIKELDEAAEATAYKRPAFKIRLIGFINRDCEKLQKTLAEIEKLETEGTTFEDLGITSLFIDEAHNYKNLPLNSSLGQIKGINADGSKKCSDVYLKVKITQEKEDSHIVFATGTPVTNSVADVFVMQKYLVEDLLADCDIDCFDNWAGTFGEVTCAYEIDVDTDSYRLANRFNKFNNLGELSSMINLFTDFHVEGKNGLPEVESVKSIVVKKTKFQMELLSDISERVEKIRAGEVDKKRDNLLKITIDGRKIALDARLLDSETDKPTGNKIPTCAAEVARLYFKYPGKTQLVFCDMGTPKPGYNVYDDLKSRLIELGIEKRQIGFVHDATSDDRRAKLFNYVNKGIVRVLIGSTFKLGTGVNVQEQMIAVHHLDVPWRPSDMVQREGRLVRPGNTNEKVFIYRYVTDGSFDAYSWQLLENKQRFISELLTGAAKGADERKLDDAVLSYAEVKALAVGNPLVKTRIETLNELARLKTLLKEEESKRSEIENLRLILPEKISLVNHKLAALRADISAVEKMPQIVDKAPIGALIAETINKAAMSESETMITQLGDFKVYLPANFNRIHPYLVVAGKMRYTVNIVTFSTGAVTKIENFLHNLPKIEENFLKERESFEIQLSETSFDDSACKQYEEKISVLQNELHEIDEKLGI